ncbi:unnamed protein product [Brassica rapa]|uniref:Uncharacterized protein n=2 Tax=Brassica TaxID=3705 RepID=A0A8D9HAD6_BRACM|nr:unnamed protein product [Brassica napus]CAG7894624.1 unnamed protein product [Brassica rapa]
MKTLCSVAIKEHASRFQLNWRQSLMSFPARFPAPLSLSLVPQRRSHDDKQRVSHALNLIFC